MAHLLSLTSISKLFPLNHVVFSAQDKMVQYVTGMNKQRNSAVQEHCIRFTDTAKVVGTSETELWTLIRGT